MGEKIYFKNLSKYTSVEGWLFPSEAQLPHISSIHVERGEIKTGV